MLFFYNSLKKHIDIQTPIDIEKPFKGLYTNVLYHFNDDKLLKGRLLWAPLKETNADGDRPIYPTSIETVMFGKEISVCQ